jgi:nickel superoxide dismutase
MTFWRRLRDRLPATIAYAHCDIPCGVYDPASALISARAIHALVGKIKALPTKGTAEELINADSNFMRMVLVKEREAQRCKEELLILWTDHFKPEHLKTYPDLHDKIWQATKQCSIVKRSVSEPEAKKLLDMVTGVADMFNRTK